MWDISEPLLVKAKEAAKKMITGGEIISSIPFGGQEDVIFLSSDPNLVKGTDEFELDGKKFFIGTKN